MDYIVSLRDGLHRPARWGASRPKFVITLFCYFLVAVIGVVDYLSGTEITLSVIYVLPIAIAAWFVDGYSAILLSLLSVVVWVYGDYFVLGIKTSSALIPVWNGFIRFTFYIFFVFLLTQLRSLQKNLTVRVHERAAALTKEIAERERLERQMLQISEREQRRIGQDLHDGLCQHLTGMAFASFVLAEKLENQGLAETDDTRKIIKLTEEAIKLARGIAKGLHPIEPQADGLMLALEEFATTTSEIFKISCKFECDSPVLIQSISVATHLYRIAQEGVSNAIRHGHATQIAITLAVEDSGINLCISDNGHGIEISLIHAGGMGLRIMTDRARVIGGAFYIGRSASGGTKLSCIVSEEICVMGVSGG